jgi:hypothetical protein
VAEVRHRTEGPVKRVDRSVYALAVLFAINMMNFFDRNIFGAIGEAIRKE